MHDRAPFHDGRNESGTEFRMSGKRITQNAKKCVMNRRPMQWNGHPTVSTPHVQNYKQKKKIFKKLSVFRYDMYIFYNW